MEQIAAIGGHIEKLHEDARAFLLSFGFDFEGGFKETHDKEVIKFQTQAGNKKIKCWLKCCYPETTDSQGFCITFGAFSSTMPAHGTKTFWADSNSQLTEKERKAINERLALGRQQAREREKHDKKVADDLADWCLERYQNASPTGLSPYFDRKCVKPCDIRFEIRKSYDVGNITEETVALIPLRDINGGVRALEEIYPSKRKFHPDAEPRDKNTSGKYAGCFFTFGKIEDGKPILLSEGYATAASLFASTNDTSLMVITRTNILNVAKAINQKYPNSEIIICGDDDIETKGNPGRTDAIAAANYINATTFANKPKCRVVFPEFPKDKNLDENGKAYTDFNDLHVHFGMDEVRDQLHRVQELEKQGKSSEPFNQSNSFKFRSAYSLTQHSSKSNWLIKPYIDIGSLCELFGEPGSLKTFFALDMGLSIATGISYHGLPIRKSGIVFYIAGEGFHGIPKRLQAWSLANGVDLKNIPFFVSNRPAQFLDDVSAKEVILAIDELKTKHGEPTFVVIDTLNRNFGPGDEKDNADMTKFILAIDTAIRLRYDCTVLILHHPPLNDSKRGRGASALYGALDWAYSLRKDGKVIKLSNTKVKDHEPPPDICFTPETIPLLGWIDEEDGTTMTSCVLKKVSGGATEKNDNKSKLTPPQKVAFDCLLKLCGTDCSDDSESVHIDVWRSAAYEAGISSSPKQDAKKKAFQRAVDDLRAQKLIKVHNDHWKPCGTRDTDGTLAGHVP